MRKIFMIPVLVLLLCGSCKNTTNTNTIEKTIDSEYTDEEGRVYEKVEKKKVDPSSVTPIDIIQNRVADVNESDVRYYREEAEKYIRGEWKASGKKSYIVLDQDLFVYDAILALDDITRKDFLKGYWIDFDQDLTYRYGVYGEVLGRGIYDYNFEKQLIVMLDDDLKTKPMKLKILHIGDSMVFEGSSDYGDGNIQGKLVRVKSVPEKE